jgi:tRNA modification GTPase
MHDTSIACLTPPGAGAIATLAVRGPQAWSVTRSLFQRSLPEHPRPGTFHLGRFGEEANACDEVVLTVKPDGLELHCHGGTEVVRFVLDAFTSRGVRLCSWNELLQNDGSPLRRLARDQLVHAPTVRTAAVLLDQVNGALEKALTETLSRLQENERARAAGLLARLEQTQRLGRHLVQPFRLVIAGAPNVGKSSLVNALAGFTRSVVSPVPGTTRDLVTTRIALDGWPVELIDTAGLHQSDDLLEREGMARTRAILQEADLRLWVLDASTAPQRPASESRAHGCVINKIDLPAVWDDVLPSFASVSCRTGQGIPEFIQRLGRLLELDAAPAPGEGVAFTPELGDRTVLAHQAARAGDWEKCVQTLRDLLRGAPFVA